MSIVHLEALTQAEWVAAALTHSTLVKKLGSNEIYRKRDGLLISIERDNNLFAGQDKFRWAVAPYGKTFFSKEYAAHNPIPADQIVE